ncbi:MAG TPA: family 43 glycosylhydrolase, partial [Bacteroidales bacterium]|nr:family 43 glycosylhydrolase [Bacteroidales bacterium]
MFKKITLSLTLLLLGAAVMAQNTIIRDQFSADPSALVVGDRVYVFPSHDIPAPEDYPRKDWFCMRDYHVFSSENLTDWTDHGVILDQKDVPWGDPSAYSMWAPDCAVNKGKYYFFFPDFIKREGTGGNFIPFRVGVAVADHPAGPYTPREKPIEGVYGIGPCIFVDDDGQGYLVWPSRGINIAKLNDDWSELAEKPTPVGNLPSPGLIEGPYLFKANGKYYMTFPWAR